MKVVLVFFIFFTFIIPFNSGYKILAIYPFHGKSHHLVLQEVGKSLAAKRHQVDVVSYFPLKDSVPNYTDIIHLTDFKKPFDADYKYISSQTSKFEVFNDVAKKTCAILKNPRLQKLIKNKNTKYDLLLVHYANGFQCFSALGHHWNIPVVGIVTTWPYPHMSDFVAQPLNLALYPSYINSYENSKMNFWERLHNVVTTYIDVYKFDLATDYEQNFYINKYIGSDVPKRKVLVKTATSLLLTNSHYSFHGVKPKSPGLIEIGGIHIKNDSSTLDKDLEQFLEESEHGFIYLSFGTLVKIETFPREILHKLYETIRKVSPVRVVVRVPNPESMPKNWPENTFVHHWLPQQFLLQHPKIRGFVTHGGAHSVQEGLYHAVPMICVPFFADQLMNCDMVRKKNLGLKVDFNTALQENYDRAFQEILSNPIYKQNAKSLSAVYRDRPRSPREEAVYWIEYVIRHGKNILKSPAVNLEWWQIELLDVYCFIAFCILLTFGVAVFILSLILFRLRKMVKSEHYVLDKKYN